MGAKRGAARPTEAQTAQKPPKILVIGVTGLAGVRCLDWLSLRQVPNLADFQVVVLSMAALSEYIASLQQEIDRATAEGREAVEKMGSRLSDDLSLLKTKLFQVLRAGGEVYAILAPARGLLSGGPHWYSIVHSDQWIPLPARLRDEPGDTPDVKEAGFSRYFARVRRWTHVFDRRYDRRELEPVIEGELQPKPRAQLVATDLATDWQGNAVGTAVQYTLHRATTGDISRALGHEYEDEPYLRSGPLFLLPPPTEVSDEEAVRILLEDFCGVAPRSVPPDWAGDIDMPGDDARKAAVAKATEALEQAQRKQQEALDAQAAADEFKRLLYEKGPPLQEVTRKTFETIGISTVDSPVSDEFMLVWEGEKVLVEVTGAGKSIAQRDLSQLMKDLSNYLAEVDQDIKGVLVGNAWVALPPHQRGTPDKPIFPDNVQKTASNRGIALLSTLELFNAYCALSEGKVTPEHVFRRIADSTGVVKLVD